MTNNMTNQDIETFFSQIDLSKYSIPMMTCVAQKTLAAALEESPVDVQMIRDMIITQIKTETTGAGGKAATRINIKANGETWFPVTVPLSAFDGRTGDTPGILPGFRLFFKNLLPQILLTTADTSGVVTVTFYGYDIQKMIDLIASRR